MDTPSSVTVIGGGVIGLACGWKLARAGLRVTLLESSQSAPPASRAALGVLTPSTPLGDTALHRLHRQSLDLFESFARDLGTESGHPVRHWRCGSLRLITGPSQRRERQREAEACRAQGWELEGRPALELLSEEECRQLEPAARVNRHGGLHNRAAARIEVDEVLRALREACRRTGVAIHEGDPVDRIQLREERVEGVRTQGELRPCEGIVVCAGAWTSGLHPLLERFAPMRPVRGQSLVLEAESAVLGGILHRDEAYLVPLDGGRMVVGSTTEPEAAYDTSTTPAGIHGLLGSSLDAVPALAGAAIRELRAGLRPRGPDEKPHIGAVPGVRGLWVATGHYKTGFGFAPLTAEAIRELVVTGKSGFELGPLLPRHGRS